MQTGMETHRNQMYIQAYARGVHSALGVLGIAFTPLRHDLGYQCTAQC